MDIRGACEGLLEIVRYAEAGRLNKGDIERAEELWRTVKTLGPIFCDDLRKRYVEIGARVQVGEMVAVKDTDGAVVIRPFLGLRAQIFQGHEEPG